MEVSLIQKWDKHLKDLASAFPARTDDKIPEQVRSCLGWSLAFLGVEEFVWGSVRVSFGGGIVGWRVGLCVRGFWGGGRRRRRPKTTTTNPHSQCPILHRPRKPPQLFTAEELVLQDGTLKPTSRLVGLNDIGASITRTWRVHASNNHHTLTPPHLAALLQPPTQA